MIQVYTGKGKGKTTAALGLALRSLGAGHKVYIGQFLKGRTCSELAALKKIKGIKCEQFGRSCFVKSPSEKDSELAKAGLDRVRKIISSKKYNVVILDEINVAVCLGLVDIKDLLRLVKKAPKRLELILTGRDAHHEVLKIADLVSNVQEIKHYFNDGVKARKGIEY